MVFPQFVALAVVASAAVAFFMYWSVRNREPRNIWLVVLTIIVSGIVTSVAFTSYLALSWFFFTSVAVAVLAAMLPVLYRRRPLAFMAVIFIVAYAAAVSLSRPASVGMFGVGMIVGALYSQRYLSARKEDRSMRKAAMEMKRDLIQMALGLAVLVVMLVWQQGYFYIMFWVILVAYLFNNLISKTGSAFRWLSRFERRDAEFGLGAMHLAAGAAILLGFADYRLALFGIFPLFFGDALATMTGISFYRSRKLPHNRRKSYAGTISFFIAVAAPGVIILGIWGVLLAAVLALVESIELPVDDNTTVPIATLILGRILGL